MMEGTKLIKLR